MVMVIVIVNVIAIVIVIVIVLVIVIVIVLVIVIVIVVKATEVRVFVFEIVVYDYTIVVVYNHTIVSYKSSRRRTRVPTQMLTTILIVSHHNFKVAIIRVKMITTCTNHRVLPAFAAKQGRKEKILKTEL